MDADIDDYQTESYNYNDEPRPDSVIYTEIFSDLKTCTREAANLLRQPLANSTFQSPITAGLQKEVAKRTKEDFPDQATFAVIGDMKAGMCCAGQACLRKTKRPQGKALSSTRS